MNKMSELKTLIEDLEMALEIESITSDIKDNKIEALSKQVERLSSDATKSMVMYQQEKKKSDSLERELMLATDIIHNLQLKVLAVTGEKIEY